MSWTRGAALAALAGGTLLVFGNALLIVDPDARGLESGADYPTVTIVVVGALLVAAGLVGVHARQRASYGRLGLTGFVLTLVAQLATAAYLANASEAPLLLALVTGAIGSVLLTIAIVRAPVLPRWTGYVAFIGFVGLLIVGDADLGIAAAGVAWLVIGYTVSTEPERVTAVPFGARRARA